MEPTTSSGGLPDLSPGSSVTGTPQQPCDTPCCSNPAAYATRKAAAYCTTCIDATYRAGGLEPLGGFTKRRDRRPTRCLACSVELTYPLDYVLEKNQHGEPVCRVCFWHDWAQPQKARKTSLDHHVRAALLAMRDNPRSRNAELDELLRTNVIVQDSADACWWPTERIGSVMARLHHDVLLDTAVEHGHSDGVNDGWDPVVARCRVCGFDSVMLPGRLGSELAGRWCSCPSCQARNKGSCPSDVLLGFESHGMTIAEPVQGTDTVQAAECRRCRTPRRISIRKLNRGHVPCYVCDGAADPASEHRVYLFHFPAWGAYKVGITNSGNDRRLETHVGNGGILVEIITVAHRGAALWVEAQVLTAVRSWPVSGEPLELRVTGWTEMWDAAAPVTITLADYTEAAAAIEVDAELVVAWHADHAVGVVADVSALDLRLADRVCFTGSSGERGATGQVWAARARAAGLPPARDLSPGVVALVCGESGPGPQKLVRARELDIPVITYEAFSTLIGERLPGR